MPINPYGTPIPNVANVYVQNVPPGTVVTGAQTDIICAVGTTNGGPKNSPVNIGNMQQFADIFGNLNPIKYDLGTFVYAATLQGAANFKCVRVTDGTDTSSSVALMDLSTPAGVGAYLTSIYTGTLYNSISAVISQGSSYTSAVPTYKLTIFKSGGYPETYDNIGGTGNAFWQNLVTAVNQGQSTQRGPSQLVIASLGTGVGTATLVAAGTGYVAGNILTIAGGTNTVAATITVDTVSSGAIATYHITNRGNYSVLPSNPAAVTGGAGTGATFNLTSGAPERQ